MPDDNLTTGESISRQNSEAPSTGPAAKSDASYWPNESVTQQPEVQSAAAIVGQIQSVAPTQTPGISLESQDAQDAQEEPKANSDTLDQQEQRYDRSTQIQYPGMTPHGQQPYYHDPMLQAQYHHPQAGYMNQVPNPPGTKAKRKRASPHQLALLNQIFEYTFFPSTELRNAIGKELGMAPRTVQIWFQNRRQSWRSQKNRDGSEDPPKTNDNERGGWEVLRSFQARRANGEIQEYEYMSIPGPSGANGGHDVRLGPDGYMMAPYHPGMMQVALSSNDQFNSSMQQLPMPMPMPLPHSPHPNPRHQQQQQQQPLQQISADQNTTMQNKEPPADAALASIANDATATNNLPTSAAAITT